MRRRFFTADKQTAFDYNNYLTIEALEDNVEVILPQGSIEYGIDGYGWKNYEDSIFLLKGQLLSLRDNKIYNHNRTIKINGKCNLLGNCMSLHYKDAAKGETRMKGTFADLFRNCVGIQKVSSNFLPATILENGCYGGMFYGCSSLTTAPALPATTLAGSCYGNMFHDCTSLTTAPALPATTLANECYDSMFNGCTGLTTAPALPATTLTYRCYENMFHGCSKLNYIKMLATDISAIFCLAGWVSNVASTGTFVKNPDATWEKYGSSGIPNGWTVVMDGEDDEGTYDDVFGELPPESTRFEFPLYLNITELDYEYPDYKEYIRNNDDDIIDQLINWFDDNYIVYDGNEGRWEYINLNESHQIYINGSLITELRRYMGSTAIECLPAPSPFTECFAELGSLYGVVYI